MSTEWKPVTADEPGYGEWVRGRWTAAEVAGPAQRGPLGWQTWDRFGRLVRATPPDLWQPVVSPWGTAPLPAVPAAPAVEYRQGLPSNEVLRAHAKRGGWWQVQDDYGRHPPAYRRLWVDENGALCSAPPDVIGERPVRPVSPPPVCDPLPWPGEAPSAAPAGPPLVECPRCDLAECACPPGPAWVAPAAPPWRLVTPEEPAPDRWCVVPMDGALAIVIGQTLRAMNACYPHRAHTHYLPIPPLPSAPAAPSAPAVQPEEPTPRDVAYIVLRQIEVDPPEVFPFRARADADAFYERASMQWTGVYLCQILRAADRPHDQQPAPAVRPPRRGLDPFAWVESLRPILPTPAPAWQIAIKKYAATPEGETHPTPATCRACGAPLIEQTATHCWPRCAAPAESGAAPTHPVLAAAIKRARDAGLDSIAEALKSGDIDKAAVLAREQGALRLLRHILSAALDEAVIVGAAPAQREEP